MRRDLIIGILVSLLVHGGVAWWGELAKGGQRNTKQRSHLEVIQLIEMPKIEPDEIDVTDEAQQNQPPAEFAPPMQTDVPSIVMPNSFVQQLQPPPPQGLEVNNAAIVIPQNTGNWGRGMPIFDVSQLDQIPIAIVQVKPQYPFEMRRAGVTGEVVVEFSVDTQGDVHNAYAVSSTQRDFEEPAVQAVGKWRFRPGRKSGRAVNTQHMQVPVVFSLNAEE